MNLVADENIDRGIVERLRRDGHQVDWIAELSPSISDEEILRRAVGGGAVLVTEDKDFGELVHRRRLSHAGVLLVRLEGLDNATKAEIVSAAVRDNAADLPGAFAVVSHDSVRLRRPAGGKIPDSDAASDPAADGGPGHS
jgi:predicted nuclease of predicted toxin-antitoxin system